MGNYSKRVLDILHGRLCPYCGSVTKIVSVSSGAYIVACDRYPVCDSYTFGDSLVMGSKGRLADASLRFERSLSEYHIARLSEAHGLTRREILDSLSIELGVSEPYLDTYYLKLETCRILTTLVVRKKLAMDYQLTKRYVNHSARKGHKGKLLRCVILWRFNPKETLVEFDDGHREKVNYIR